MAIKIYFAIFTLDKADAKKAEGNTAFQAGALQLSLRKHV